jgi:hypothetical protein
MFSVFCPGHHAEVLLGPDNILLVASEPDGIGLHWRCFCGESGVERTPRPPTPERVR